MPVLYIVPPTHSLTVYIAARKVNVIQEFISLSQTIGDNFTIPCNIEGGVNTAQTRFTVTIERQVVFDSRDNISEPVIQYVNHNALNPSSISETRNGTLYTFHPSNFTIDVVNFSIPYPEQVRGVKYFCMFYTVVLGTAITEQTTTAVIPGFSKPTHIPAYSFVKYNY